MNYEINTDKCTFCGICVNECPSGVITVSRQTKTAMIEHVDCIECSHCGMVCPAGAVTADGIELESYKESDVLNSEKSGFNEAFNHLIKSKRSVRSYKQLQPSDEEIEKIILAGQLTATATNSMNVRVMLVKGEDVAKISKLTAKVALRIINIGNNPFGRFLIKIAGLKKYARKDFLAKHHESLVKTIKGEKDIFFFKAPAAVILTYPAKSKRFGRTDCALAGQNMMLTAHAMGIGSCMIGFAEAALFTKRLRKKIGVPSDRRIGLVFSLGYQKTEYYRYPIRKEWGVGI